MGTIEWESVEASTADLHVVEAAPGTGKSLPLVTNAKLLGALKCLNLVYNNTTAPVTCAGGELSTRTRSTPFSCARYATPSSGNSTVREGPASALRPAPARTTARVAVLSS